jgi:hypothetical protein
LAAYSTLDFVYNVARQRQCVRYSRLQRKQRDLGDGNPPEMYRERKSYSFDLLKGHRRKAPTCSRTAFYRVLYMRFWGHEIEVQKVDCIDL